jgi:hypothetical protein
MLNLFWNAMYSSMLYFSFRLRDETPTGTRRNGGGVWEKRYSTVNFWLFLHYCKIWFLHILIDYSRSVRRQLIAIGLCMITGNRTYCSIVNRKYDARQYSCSPRSTVRSMYLRSLSRTHLCKRYQFRFLYWWSYHIRFSYSQCVCCSHCMRLFPYTKHSPNNNLCFVPSWNRINYRIHHSDSPCLYYNHCIRHLSCNLDRPNSNQNYMLRYSRSHCHTHWWWTPSGNCSDCNRRIWL